MERIVWIWDEAKARINFEKHRIEFSEAIHVFEDPLHLSKVDPHPDGDRWQTIGLVGSFHILVVHTFPVEWESAGKLIGRIISARIATSHEKKSL